jgi:DNA-binding IclR family transcriptional regulator
MVKEFAFCAGIGMIRRTYPPVKTIYKTFSLLEALAEIQPASVSELRQKLDLTRSNLHRFLATLVELQYVEKTHDSRYRLTFKLFEVGSTVLRGRNLKEFAYPEMVHLAEISQENVNLAVLVHHRVLYVDKIESPHSLKLDKAIGETDPIYCTALGKALLSGLNEAELDVLLKSIELAPFTKRTIVDPEVLVTVVQGIKKSGYSTDFEESAEGIHCVGAPIYGDTNRVVAAISISGPSVRMTKARIRQLVPELVRASKQISRRLGAKAFPEAASNPKDTLNQRDWEHHVR